MTSTFDFAACLHVCSQGASAGAIKMLLRKKMGIPRPSVVHSDMSENTGPLSLLDQPEQRFDWFLNSGFDVHVYEGFGADEQEAVIARWRSFWTQIDEWRGPFLFWYSHMSAQDQSLLLSLCNLIGQGRPVFLMDVAEPAGDKHGVTSVGELSPDNLQCWLPQIREVDAALAETLRTRYSAFVTTTEDLRVFIEATVLEAPIKVMDDRILSQFSKEWTSLRRVAAEIPGAFGRGGYRDLNYSWLLWRLDALQRAGLIERRGGSFDPDFREDPLVGEVRLSG
ncbi:MAG: DUF3658 domain-containing protein [Hyphomonas sp.]